MFGPGTLAGVSLILLIVQSESYIWQPNNLKNEIICDSVDCIRRGKFYKDNMDDHVHPCQDFYTFTCGNWLKSHPGPKYSAEWLIQDIMISDFTKIIRDTLESYKNDKEAPILLHRAMEVYDICVKIPDYPKTEANNIAKKIMKVGRLPNTRLWDMHTKYLNLTGESALFGIRIIGQFPSGIPLLIRHPRQLIAMRQTKYFIDLMDLLKNVSADVLAFHMEIHFIERHLKFNNKMYNLLEGTSVEPHIHLRYIREKFHPRWETCIENHNMKLILEKIVYDKWFKGQQKEQTMIRQLIIDTKLKIFELMTKSDWMDLRTRATTLEKLNDVKSWIGFPPWVTGDAIPKRRNPATILKPNAELNVEENFLYIYAPILLSPIFNLKMPALYNYAGIGTTIGHELYHVINACGTYSTTTGSITWWSNEVQEKCIKKLLSFVKAYNEVTNREFKNRYNVVLKSNTTRTVLENYPDVMGLEAAYSVYKDSVSKDNSICKTLPYFAEYSCDQMFYIAFANTYCGHYSKKAALRKLETSHHSIESIRINGAVAQMESFGRAFNCPVGSPMNPEEKVNLWK